MAAVTICSDFGAQENKVCHCFYCFPICHEMMELDAMILVFWMLSFKPDFSLSSFTFIKRLFTFSSPSIYTNVRPFGIISNVPETLFFFFFFFLIFLLPFAKHNCFCWTFCKFTDSSVISSNLLLSPFSELHILIIVISLKFPLLFKKIFYFFFKTFHLFHVLL